MTFWSTLAIAKATHDTLTHLLFWIQKRFDEDTLRSHGGHLPQLARGKAESFVLEYSALLQNLSWLHATVGMDPDNVEAVFEGADDFELQDVVQASSFLKHRVGFIE